MIGKLPGDHAAILLGAQATPCTAAQQRWTLVAAILGTSMAFVDGTVVNVALPALQTDLRANAFDAQWVIESYALFLAALLLAGGALGDRFGRRRVFTIGVAVFVAASLACAASRSVHALIGARALQGIGAALLVPGSLALLSAVFPEAERGRAIGTWSACSGISAAIGPVIGGFLVEHYAWPWAFLINLPVGLALLAICAFKVPESRSAAARGRVDVAGATLATLGLAGIVFALIEAPSRGAFDTAVLGAGAAGVASLALFVRVEATRPDPMLPLALFRVRSFSGANLLTLLLYAALGGALFFLPLNLIQVQGLGATAAGAAMLPFIAILFALSSWAGRLVDRFGAKRPLMIGPAIAAVGFAALAVPGVGAGYWSGFFPAICVLGLGMAITVAPLTTTVMNAVAADRAGAASGVNNAVSRTASLLAIAVFGGVMAWRFDATLALQLAPLHLPADALAAIQAQTQKLAGLVVPPGLGEAAAAGATRAVGAAFVDGFRWVMGISAGLAAASALSAGWLIDGQRPAPRDVADAPG